MSPTIILPLLKQESETVDKCYICDEKFKDFDAHFETFHGQENDIKEFKCNTCLEIFPRPKKLKNHILTKHEIRKEYKCEFCEKDFKTSTRLKEHIDAVHEGKRNYKCKWCDESFLRPKNLNCHYNAVHKGFKKYKCDFCDKNFSWYKNLNIHKNAVHKGSKNSTKIFKDSTDDAVHEEISRNGDKLDKKTPPIFHKKRSKAFSKNSHILWAIGHPYFENPTTPVPRIENLNCDSCDKSFSSLIELKSHTDQNHKNFLILVIVTITILIYTL